MKNSILLIALMLNIIACKNFTKDKPATVPPQPQVVEPQFTDSIKTSLDSIVVTRTREPMPQMNDSIKVWLDSVITRLATINKCRITAVIGSDSAQSYYNGYDGRQQKKITDFGESIEIGSCTKMFTASSILQLIEQQKLSLDDQLTSVLPNASRYKELLVINGKDYIDSVNVLNLLNHSSGLPDYLGDDDEKEIELYGDASLKFTPDQLIALAKENKSDPFIPGTSYKYCNTNYILLGLIIEKLTGQTYQEYIQENILNPLALKHTYFGSINPPTNVAEGHYKGKVVVMPPTLSGPAGEIISNLEDMQTFIRAWSMGQLFESDSFMEQVKKEHFLQMEDIIDMKYGMGVIKLLSRSLGHGGQTFGFQSYIASLSTPYSFAVAIDDASVDSWLPAVLLTNYLGEVEEEEESPDDVEALQ